MSEMVSQIIGVSIVCSALYSGAYQRKHQSSASLAFVRGIHRLSVYSPHKGPITRKMFPFDDIIMINATRLLASVANHVTNRYRFVMGYIDGLVQDCSNSSALAME